MDKNSDNNIENLADNHSVKSSCLTYKESVQCTLKLINSALKKSLESNYDSLQVLFDNIGGYTSTTDQYHTTSLPHRNSTGDQIEKLTEFDEMKLNLKDNVRRIVEKLEQIETAHKQMVQNLLCREKLSETNRFRQVEKNKGSFDKIIICKNFVESDTSEVSFNEQQNMKSGSEVVPDILRRRAFEDLHLKLIQQLEATDSLEGFIKLMQRKIPAASLRARKRKAEKKGGEEQSLKQKYNGSLWFFPDSKNSKYRKVYEDSRTPLSINSSQSGKSIASTTTTSDAKKKLLQKRTTVSTCTCNVQSKTSTFQLTPEEKSPRLRCKIEREKLKYYDILDDIATKDLEPLKAEYPRKDNMSETTSTDTYLERILTENDKVWKQLLQPSTAVKRRKVKNKSVQKLMEYLTEPQQRFYQQQKMIVMPVKCYYDNVPTKEASRETGMHVSFKEDCLAAVTAPKEAAQESTMHSTFKEDCLAAVNALKDTVQGYRHDKVNFITDLTKKPEHVSPNQNIKKSPRKEDAKAKPSQQGHLKGTVPRAPPQVHRRKVMLEHLRDLKARNDDIQKNIQKAIDVIETKMIDILSSPSNSDSTQAFHAMEEEITKVLKMMTEEENNQSNIEKIEPEKDLNHVNTKVKNNGKKSKDFLNKSGILNFVPGVDLDIIKKPEDNVPEVLTKSEPNKKMMSKEEVVLNIQEVIQNSARASRDVSPNKKIDLKLDGIGDQVKTEQTSQNLKEDLKEIIKKEAAKYKTKISKKTNRLYGSGDKKSPPRLKKKSINMEDSEKLLGQVDHVVKKIDTIYQRFHYNNKSHQVDIIANESTATVETQISDTIKRIAVETAMSVEYAELEGVLQTYNMAKSFGLSRLLYETKMKEKEPEVIELEATKQDVTTEECYNEQLSEKGLDEDSIMALAPICPNFDVSQCYENHADELEAQIRHANTLKLFYFFFYSALFVALSLDYSC